MNSTSLNRRRPASGLVLMVALICLAVITLALTAMFSRAAQGRRQLVQRQRQIQAQWLLESAFDRAAARLRQDPAYEGENWRLSAEDLGDRSSAEISIEVELSEMEPSGVIRASVRYPREGAFSVQQEKQVPISIPSVGEAI